jgi:hypothetical protein
LSEGGTARLAAGSPKSEIREPSGGGVNFGAWPGIWASELGLGAAVFGDDEMARTTQLKLRGL